MNSPFLYDQSDINRRYDTGRHPASATLDSLTAMFQRHSPPQVRRVLDLGCGTGRFSTLLSDTINSPVIGLDLSANMLNAASSKPRTDDIRFVRGSLTDLPLNDGTIDVVFISQALHHLPNLEAAMAEIRRVLSPNGRLFVRQATRENLDSYFYQRFFPEARAIDEARLPTRDHITTAARSSRLLPLEPFETIQVEFPSAHDYLTKISLRTNSDLAMISDESFAAGMKAFAAYIHSRPQQSWTEKVDQMAFGVNRDA